MGKTNRHELTVSPKQLVFLTMIAVIGAVVVFLCGVGVGRGLKTAEAGSTRSIPAVSAAGGASGAGGAAAEAGPGGASGSPFQDMSYFDRLRRGEPVAETLETPAPGPAPPRAGFTAPGFFAGAHGGAFAVQVMSVRGAAAAADVKADLEAKGYPVVIEPMPRIPGGLHRVSVGPYADRAEAELVSHRLRTQERFASWVTQP